MHEQLARELRRLGLSEDAQPDTGAWQELLRFVSESFDDADRTAYRFERSLRISGEEGRYLHARQRTLASCASSLLMSGESDGWSEALEALVGVEAFSGAWLRQLDDSGRMQLVGAVGDVDNALGAGPSGSSSNESDQIVSPITVSGRVEGELGVVRNGEVEAWGDDRHLIETVASMFGAHWRQLATTRDLEALLEAKDRFVASVSHELRTPLTAVVGFAGHLHSEWDTVSLDEAKSLVEVVYEQARDVSDLIDDLLVVARSEIDALKLEEIPVDLLAEATSVGLRFLESPSTIEYEGGGIALADPRRVRQIVRNLVTNAFRYGGDRITIRITEQAGFVSLAVCDNGDGVPDDLRELVFQPFLSGHSPRTQPDSIGLGLWVGRSLAQSMGGALELQQDQGDTRFILTLPRFSSLATVNGSPVASSPSRVVAKPV